jgi:PmbA protein
MNESRALEIVERALGAAGGDEADVTFAWSARNISRFANSGIHQNMSETSGTLTIRVFADGRMGIASTSSMEHDDISAAAAVALDLARRSEPLHGFRGIYSGNEPLENVGSADEASLEIAPLQKAGLLRDMFARGREAGVEFAGSFSTSSGCIAAANSRGVRRWAPVTLTDATAIAIGERGSGYATAASRRFSSVDIPSLGDEAARRATLAVDSPVESIEPGPWDVILEPPALAEVFEWMNQITFSGASFEDGSSFFVGNEGQRLLGRGVTLADDAVDDAFLPFPFDMEGMPKRRVALVEQGTIRTPVVDKLLADRLGIEPTASAAALGSEDHGTALHLSMAGGSSSVEEMIATTERGIWVTRFNYVNGLLDPRTALMTGMTRDGTFLIENGRVTGRLPSIRWTQSMTEAFSAIDAISRERRIVGAWWNPTGGVLAPAVRVRGWNVTGVQRQARLSPGA